MTPFLDAHLHIIDPRFPLVPNHGYRPAPFTVADYRARVGGLGVRGGVVVAGSFHGTDQRHLLTALRELGPGFAGVTNLPEGATDEDVLALHAGGVRAVRVNLVRGGGAAPADLDRLARRVWDLAGWHVELYADATGLRELEGRILALPKAAVDHLGMTAASRDVLLRLAAGGVAVKATGFGRVDLDVPGTLRAVHAAAPGALMAGTDLPSTRARRPFADEDLRLIANTLGPDAARAVLHDNAARFYGGTVSP